MKKIFYLTKDYIKEVLKIDNVITGNLPITLINSKILNAKQFRWKNESDLKNDDMWKNCICSKSYIYLYEIDQNKYQNNFNSILPDDIHKIELVEDINTADEILARLYE